MKNTPTLYFKFWGYFLQRIIRKVTGSFTSADIIFSQIFRTSFNIIWKKDFCHEFSFFNEFNQPPHPPSIPLMAKFGWVWRKVFEPPTKFLKSGYLIGPQLLEPHFLKVTKNLLTFKRKDSAKDEKLWFFFLRGVGGGSLKNQTFKGGSRKKNNRKGGGGDLDSLLI